MRLLLLVVVLVAAGSAQGAPDGFRESARLTPRVRAISGNEASVVFCASNTAAWATRMKEYLPDANPSRIVAFYVYDENAAYFQAHICSALERWLRGKPVTQYEVGVAALSVAHEAHHARGIIDERQAECDALARLPRTLRVHFAVKNPLAVRAMVAAARADNRRRLSVRC